MLSVSKRSNSKDKLPNRYFEKRIPSRLCGVVGGLSLRGENLAAAGGECMSRQYVPLSDLLASKKAWSVVRLLDNKQKPAEKLEVLEQIFVTAVNAHDDGGAVSLIEMIMSCINDVELLPLVKKDKFDRFELPTDTIGEHNIKIPEAKYRAMIARASKARELFAKVPSVKILKNELVRDSEGAAVYRDVERPTLSQTKEMLLLEIANGWKQSRGEVEADEVLFILPQKRKARSGRHSERQKVFPSSRISECDCGRTRHVSTGSYPGQVRETA